MNLKALTLTAILGLSAPAITDIAVSNKALANSRFDYPSGEFVDSEWQVNLYFRNNAFYYEGRNIRKDSSIVLVGATTSGNKQRQIYTWRNDRIKLI